MMNESNIKNRTKLIKILDMIGYEDAVIRRDGAWDLSIFYTSREEKLIVIEMCASERVNGDMIVDPLMRIELLLDTDGNITEVHPVFYQSQTIMGEVELYAKDNTDCWNQLSYMPKITLIAGIRIL